MNVLAKPRHPLIERALADARRWSAGHIIDDRPALAHAAAVAATIGRHVPDAEPTLIAAALLHDVHDFDVPDLDTALRGYGPRVPYIIDALRAEHAALDGPDPQVMINDPEVRLASTADKIVALASLLRRAHRSGDPDRFFTARPALLRLLDHFHACQQATVGHVPTSMSSALATVLTQLEHATTTARHHHGLAG